MLKVKKKKKKKKKEGKMLIISNLNLGLHDLYTDLYSKNLIVVIFQIDKIKEYIDFY